LPGEGKTFREMMENTLQSMPQRSYLRNRSGVTPRILTSSLGGYTLTEITPRVVNEYKEKRRRDGPKPGSINREISTMKKAFNLAVKESEWVKDNPVARVSMEEENNKRDRWLTTEEEERVLEVCPLWVRELVTFALNTGMRFGEILSLEWKRVDLFKRTVAVFESKNKEPRTIPINERVFEILKNKVKVKSIKTNLAFYTNNHTMILKTSVDHAFQTALKRAGIKDFRFHDLRHTAATRMVQAGKDLYKI
jgi:integrase